MMQAVQKIEKSIKERRDTDVPLPKWWLSMLILTPFTFGIYGVVILFRRTTRVDRFIARKRDYYQGLLDFTEQYSREKGSYEDIKNDLEDLKRFFSTSFSSDVKEIKAGISFLLIMLTLGIWNFVWLYKMNRIWYDLQMVEENFDRAISQIWIRLGLTKYPLNFAVDPSKKKSYPLYLLLSVVTAGIWAFVWDYKIHTDPDSLYKEFHSVEDMVLQVVRHSA